MMNIIEEKSCGGNALGLCQIGGAPIPGAWGNILTFIGSAASLAVSLLAVYQGCEWNQN